ncbi:hypothetical protein [Kineococcus sp. SYSU DK001]|uniref:hypothetical protein n=1 Tax=Kineococcus sp. SYSU DK001 TaxID=3383122 RepID=UPI003D7D1376
MTTTERRRGRAAIAPVLLAVAAGCAAPRPPAPPPTTPTTRPPTTGTVVPAATALTFTTAGGLVLAATAGGGASLEDPAATDAAAPVLRWYAEPTGTPRTYVLRNAATDSGDVCLQVPAEGTVATGTCGPFTDQWFGLAARGPSAWTLRSSSGYVVAGADGALTTTADAGAATPFAVSDADDADRAGTVPDL